MPKTTFLWLPLWALSVACSGTSTSAVDASSGSPDAGMPDHHEARDAVADAPADAARDAAKDAPTCPPMNCTADSDCTDGGSSDQCIGGVCRPVTPCLGDSMCPPLSIDNDKPAATGVLSGYADPSLRRALDGSTLFMGYSYASTVSTPSGGVLSIAAHLATSTDDGATFSLVRPLFAATAAETVPGLSVQGVSSSEEISIAPAALDPTSPSTSYWISSRQKYWNPLPGEDGGVGDLHDVTTHLRIGMVQSTSPAGLGDNEANEQILTEKNNPTALAAALAPAANVRALGGILADGGHADCELAWSTSILYVAPYVYLAIECTESMIGSSNIVLLRTQPYASGAVQPPTSWAWSYVGTFGTEADAALMRVGANEIIQPEIDKMPDGTIAFVSTPAAFGAAGGSRLGCNVVRMASLDPPSFAKACGGLATIYVDRAEDLAPGTAFGDQAGSCSFEPTRKSRALIQARKVTASKQVKSTLNAVDVP